MDFCSYATHGCHGQVCQALSYQTNPIGSALIIYDVASQWFLNFHRRVQDNPFSTLGPISDLIPAVGKFHLAAHVPGCFTKFSLNFVQGAGQLDGENSRDVVVRVQ